MAKFLSKQNLEHVYDYLKRDLESVNINLDSDKKYMKAVKKMMRSIDNQANESGKTMSLDNMNVFAVSKIKPFLVEMFNKLSGGKSNSPKEFEPESLNMSIMGYDINQSESDISGAGALDALFQSTITNNAEIKEENTMSAADFQKNWMKHKILADTLTMPKAQAIFVEKFKRLICSQVATIKEFKKEKRNS